jgi:hypothetical protein
MIDFKALLGIPTKSSGSFELSSLMIQSVILAFSLGIYGTE